jgi:hypothetical protein
MLILLFQFIPKLCIDDLFLKVVAAMESPVKQVRCGGAFAGSVRAGEQYYVGIHHYNPNTIW